MYKFAWIGLDGMGINTYQLFEEYLPIVRDVIKHSLVYKIETIPPYTPPIWISQATGVNPGRHGVMDFVSTYSINNKIINKILTSRHIGFPFLWEI